MGDAKKREAAMNAGTPWPRPRLCPVKGCKSPRVVDLGVETELAIRIAGAWGNDVVAPLQRCLDCGTVWESWPAHMPVDWQIDDVEREPCDNCAYRKGSKESRDPETWAKLVSMADNWSEFGLVPEATTTTFHCHKGIPIDLTPEGVPMIKFNYEKAGLDPRHRVCRGFLNLVWAFRRKVEKPCAYQEKG